MTRTLALFKVSRLSYKDILQRIEALGPDYADMILDRPGDRLRAHMALLNMDGLAIVCDPAEGKQVERAVVEDPRVDECARLLYLSDEEAMNDFLVEKEGRGDELTEEMLKTVPWEELGPAQASYHRRAIVVIRAWEAAGWNTDLSAVPRDRDFLIKFDHGEVTIGHFLDNSKTSHPWSGIRPARSMRAERLTEKIVAWKGMPE